MKDYLNILLNLHFELIWYAYQMLLEHDQNRVHEIYLLMFVLYLWIIFLDTSHYASFEISYGYLRELFSWIETKKWISLAKKKLRIFTSIFGEFSSFFICFWNISFISSIANKSLCNEDSLSEGVEVGIATADDDDEQGGGAVKVFKAKIKRKKKLNRCFFLIPTSICWREILIRIWNTFIQ